MKPAGIHLRSTGLSGWLLPRGCACSLLRRGMTLIEMMVVVTGVAMMLGLCAVTLHLMLRLESDARSRVLATSSLDRLGSQLRSDVHAAAKAESKVVGSGASDPAKRNSLPPRPALVLTIAPGRTVTYQPRAGGLIRTETALGKTVRSDQFSLQAGQMARVEIRETKPRSVVAFRIEPASDDSQTRISRPYEVLAVLSRDHPAAILDGASAASKKGNGR